MNLAQAVSAAINVLRQFGPHHQGGAQCAVFRRVLELHSALQYVPHPLPSCYAPR